MAAVVGCGSGSLDTSPVRGTVTLDGAPYTAGGTVVFEPQTAGKMATAEIQADGSYELSTYAANDGAVVGEHKVVVRAPVMATDEATEGMPMKAPVSAIPKKYGSSASSELVFNVEPGKENTFPIEMSSR